MGGEEGEIGINMRCKLTRRPVLSARTLPMILLGTGIVFLLFLTSADSEFFSLVHEEKRRKLRAGI
jgi:hypothetical protein